MAHISHIIYPSGPYPSGSWLEYIFIGYFRGVFQTLRQIRLEEGLAGWYSGLKVNLIRQIPNNAIMMCTVEYIIYSWTRYVNQWSYNHVTGASMTSPDLNQKVPKIKRLLILSRFFSWDEPNLPLDSAPDSSRVDAHIIVHSDVILMMSWWRHNCTRLYFCLSKRIFQLILL